MKTKKIYEDLADIEKNVRDILYPLPITEREKRTGIKYQDTSAWLHDKRKWSIDKILKIAEKLGL